MSSEYVGLGEHHTERKVVSTFYDATAKTSREEIIVFSRVFGLLRGNQQIAVMARITDALVFIEDTVLLGLLLH